MEHKIEEIYNDLIPIASKVRSKYRGHSFEIDELINEAWLQGDFKKQNTKKLALVAAKMDMIDYAIRISGTKKRYKDGKLVKNERPKFLTNQDAKDGKFSQGSGKSIFDRPYSEKNFDNIDDKDFLQHLMRALDSRERLAMSTYFFEGKSMKEVSTIIGLTYCRTSTFFRETYKKMRDWIVFYNDKKFDNLVTKENLHYLITELKNKPRNIFIARFFDDKSVEEISQEFNIKEKSVVNSLIISRKKILNAQERDKQK